jgi:hypothetical protein
MGKQPNDLDVFLVVATDYQVLLKIRVFHESPTKDWLVCQSEQL